MNDNDIKRLEELNERYTSANMTAFRLVNQKTDEKTLLGHLEYDLKILN